MEFESGMSSHSSEVFGRKIKQKVCSTPTTKSTTVTNRHVCVVITAAQRLQFHTFSLKNANRWCCSLSEQCSCAVRGSLTRRRSTTIASQRDTEASRGGVIFWNCTASRFVLPRDGCCTHTLWVGHRSLARCSPMHAQGRQTSRSSSGRRQAICGGGFFGGWA